MKMKNVFIHLCVILSCSYATGLDLDDADVNSHNKVVVCYVRIMKKRTDYRFSVDDIDPMLCTHIIYEIIYVYLDDVLNNPIQKEMYLRERSHLQKIVSLKQENPKLKVLIEYPWIEYSDIKTPEKRKAFIQNVLVFIKKYDSDGFVIDWRVPTVILIKEMQTEFDKNGFLLTASIDGKLSTIDRAYFDVPETRQRHVHFIYIKAYNYHSLPFSNYTTAHNAPLRTPFNSSVIEPDLRPITISVEETVKYLLKSGASPDKLVLGVPFYGWTFTLGDKNSHEIGSASNVTGLMSLSRISWRSYLTYNRICKQLNENQGNDQWIEQWDDVAQVPYMYKGENWVSYDNEKSIAIKARYAFNQGLAGLMTSPIDYDDFLAECSNVRYPLLRAIHSEFQAAFIHKQGLFQIKREGKLKDAVEGSNVILHCYIRGYNYPYPPTWFKTYGKWGSFSQLTFNNGSLKWIPERENETNFQIMEKISEQPKKDIQIETVGSYDISQNLYVYNSTLYFKNVTLDTPDTPYTKFLCEINDKFKEISLTIKEINNEPVSNAIMLKNGTAQNLTCNRLSQFVPVKWIQDGKRYTGLVYENKTASVLQLQGKANEVGLYECRWNNSRGEARHRNFDVGGKFVEENTMFVEKNDINVIIISVTATAIGLLLFGMGISIKFYLHKKKELEKLLNGNPARINPDTPMEDQTEFIPYNKKWEFPRTRLRLGQEIGAGCFGRVLKAEAVGIKNDDETVTTVAVKRIKPTAKSPDAIVALIRELKILIYLGEHGPPNREVHLNVVNLLGACTKTIIKEDILVIIDFCRFGNLKSFLIKYRDKFVNQLNALGDMQPDNQPALLDAPISANQPIANSRQENPLPIVGDESNETLNDRIKTSDLISWSLQIARGMEFLGIRKVLHGDLAARNVLLADHGVVKVADFGMARQMKDYDYQKQGEELLPIKWMAIESLRDNIFSSQSDVWSYGIVLWELFSLGRVPYPGMANAVAKQEILNGHRMTPAEYMPNFLKEIVPNCWQTEPNERPTFHQLVEIIKRQIVDVNSHDYDV